MDDRVWVPTVFTKNRERLIEHDAIIELFALIVQTADDKGCLSNEQFSVDGTLLQAWASHKSFVRKDDSGRDIDGPGEKRAGDAADTADTADNNNNTGAEFKGQTRSNDTHESSTDADARLYCKGDNASRLRFMGNTLSDNRHGLIANARVTTADGYATAGQDQEAARANASAR